MKAPKSIAVELIAPCGMNCAICSRYLAYINNLKRSQCKGCRPSNKKCTYLFAKCTGINKNAKGNAQFCYKCREYPCQEIKRMDNRYRKNYQMSVIDNLERIKKSGIKEFADEQYKKYQCPKCGGLISVHNGKCFRCETVTRLIDKRNN